MYVGSDEHSLPVLLHVFMRERNEIGGSSTSVADDNRHRRRVGDALQHGSNGVRASLQHQAQHGRLIVLRPAFRRDLLLLNALLEAFAQQQVAAVLADGAVVDEEEVGVVSVEDDAVAGGHRHRVVRRHTLQQKISTSPCFNTFFFQYKIYWCELELQRHCICTCTYTVHVPGACTCTCYLR